MTPSPQQQLMETIPRLRDWQSRLLVRLLRFLGWIRSNPVDTPILQPSIEPLDRLTLKIYADPGWNPEQAAAIARMQQRIQEVVPEGVSLVDELIAERRAAGLHE